MCQELLLPHPSFGASADPRLTSRVSVLMTEERFGASKIGAATRHLLKVFAGNLPFFDLPKFAPILFASIERLSNLGEVGDKQVVPYQETFGPL